MAIKDSPLEVQEISSSESDGSDPGSGWDDSEQDPDYDVLEETDNKFSNLSIRNKAKACVVEGKGLGTETDPDVLEVTAPSLDEEDEENFDKVQKIIKAGLLEKLKVNECKLYLRKNGLRLTGNKDTLIQRLKEHLEIINGGGEKKYPPSSFVLNCKGDACTGDVVLFVQNVYEMFNIASRSANGPPCGQRIVAGRIVKESYGAAKQQHTFTIEVLWSKGEKPLPPLHPLLIKGRNLYRLKTLRQKWEDEGKRQKILMEKHSRGAVARADREARIQEKEKRQTIKENRVSKKDSIGNQCQSHSSLTMSVSQPQESDISINPEKPALQSQTSGLSVNTSKATSQIQHLQPAAGTQLCDKPLDSSSVVMGPHELGISIDSRKTSFPVHHKHKHQAIKHSAEVCRSTFDIDHIRRAELGTNYPDIHYREKQTTIEKYPCTTETKGFTERTCHRKPLESANHFFPVTTNREGYKPKRLCRHFARGRCYFGDNCNFSHDLREDIIRLPLQRNT